MTTPESRLRANKNYQQKAYDNISLRVKKGTREAWRSAADRAGKSLSAFIADAVNACINEKSE